MARAVSHYIVHFVLLVGRWLHLPHYLLYTNTIASQVIFTLINALICHITIRLERYIEKYIRTKATTYRVTISYHNVITRCINCANIKCGGNVVSSIVIEWLFRCGAGRRGFSGNR